MMKLGCKNIEKRLGELAAQAKCLYSGPVSASTDI